ncbi:FUSC family protein [Micromonospora sp. DPT]|uniref:FUSC family protein n=1 Tax=Micromonospora sp. DPT TaxID=3142975 RepID=UPI00320A683B
MWRPPLGTLLMAGRVALAVLLAGSAAGLLGVDWPAWAIVTAAAVLGTGSHAAAATGRALERTVGTLLGVAGAGVLVALHPQGVLLVATLTALQFLTQLTLTRNSALAMLCITPLALLLVSAAQPHPAVLVQPAR